MRPDDPQMKHPSLLVPQRPYAPGTDTRSTQPAQQQAAANVAREQVNTAYSKDPNAVMTVGAEPTTVQPEPVTEQPPMTERNSAHQVITDRKQQYAQGKPVQHASDSPYERTHSESHLQADDDRWKQYHSAWQKYYQEYYRRYYQSTHSQPNSAADNEQAVSPESAIDDLRSQLRTNIKQKSQKIRKSRHFVPLIAALSVMVVFLFLQYNRIIFANVAAYVSPGNIEPQNIIVDPNLTMQVGPDPRLIIPKINVDVPVIYDGTMGTTQQQTHERQMDAMEKGVAWFGIPGANSKPGQKGNTVLSGHSSNDWLDNGEYKFIFARLERMNINDTMYLNYKGTRYTYSIYDIRVVLPTELDALRVDNDKPVLTLITCTPLGTSEKRLLVYAEQVSPSPTEANDAPDTPTTPQQTQIPGVRSSFLGGLFD